MAADTPSDVYVTETDLSQVIGAASTSVGSIVLTARQGRIGERVFTPTVQDLINEFGEPDSAIGFGHYSAISFLAQASSLWVTRAIGEDYRYAGAMVQKLSTAAYTNLYGFPTTNPADVDPADELNGSDRASDNLAYFYATGPGNRSNVAVEITSKNIRRVSGLTAAVPYEVRWLGLTNKDVAAPVSINAYTTADIDLEGAPILGGYQVVHRDIVLVKNQRLASENDLYRVNVDGNWVKLNSTAVRCFHAASSTLFRKSATYTWGAYTEVWGATEVSNGDKVLLVGQTQATENGLYAWIAATKRWGKLPNQNLVYIRSQAKVYLRANGVYSKAYYPADGAKLDAGTYSYWVSAVNTTGEQLAPRVSVVVTSADSFVRLTWNEVAGANVYRIYGRLDDDTVGYLGQTNQTSWVDWGTVTPNVNRQRPTTYVGVPTFYVNVYDTNLNASRPQETFECTLHHAINGFGRQTELENQINSKGLGSKLVRVTNFSLGLDASVLPTMYTTPKLALSGGSSGAAVTDSDVVNAWTLFADRDKVQTNIAIHAGLGSEAVMKALVSQCTARQDTIAVLDVPSDMQTAAAAVDWRNNTLMIDSSYGAAYTPDVKILDTYHGRQIWIPPSGHVAAAYARTDRDAETWYAPAGLSRGLLDVLDVRQEYEQGERKLLRDANINYIRKIPGVGPAIMEAYTLQSKQSALSFIPVRRMLMVIETATRKALMYSLWNPNDYVLRTMIVSMISDYLESIKRARGITRYMVVCDETNNGPQSENNGLLNVDVYVQPTLPAARISLQMVITRQGMSFEEAITAAAQY